MGLVKLSDDDRRLIRALRDEREALLARARDHEIAREACIAEARLISDGHIADKFDVSRDTVRGIDRTRRCA